VTDDGRAEPVELAAEFRPAVSVTVRLRVQPVIINRVLSQLFDIKIS